MKQKDFKDKEHFDFMINRSFYLYRLKFNPKIGLPNFMQKFSKESEDVDVKENILNIQISEDEKRKHLLVIIKEEGNLIYGLFYKLKEDLEMSICDEETGEITINKLEEKKAWAEKSRFIFDTKNHLLLGEYNDAGIRFFQFPLGEYLRKSFNRDDLDIEVVYNKESYENLQNRDIKYIKIKVTKPKLSLLEDIFGLSNLGVFNEADESESLFVELRINAGRRRSFSRSFISKIIKKFDEIIDKKGIEKFEFGEADSNIPLELVKDKILRRKIDIENKSDEDIFSELVEIYEDLNIDELLDTEENEQDEK